MVWTLKYKLPYNHIKTLRISAPDFAETVRRAPMAVQMLDTSGDYEERDIEIIGLEQCPIYGD